MSFLGVGATKLSQIKIDADKDWQGMGIYDLKELAAGMVQGDIIVKGGAGILIRLPAGTANTVLTSNGPGLPVFWGPGGLYLNRFIPADVDLQAPALNPHFIPDKTITKSPAGSSSNFETTASDPAHGVLQVQPAPTLTKTLTAGFTPDQSYTKSPATISSTFTTSVA